MESLPPRKTFGTVRAQTSDTESPARTDDYYLRIANEAFDTSTTFLDTNYRKDWENSIKHFQNQHMNGSKYYHSDYKYRSKLFRPKTRATVRQAESAAAAAFFSQLDVMSLEPEDDRDPMQLAGAALRQELLNYRLSRKGQIPWFQICVGGMQEANIYGIVCSKQFWDYQEKQVEISTGQLDEMGQEMMLTQTDKVTDKPDIKLYPVENIYFHPSAEWTDVVKSSPYFIAKDPMYIGDVKQKMKSGEWITIDDNTLLTARNSSYDTTRQARSGEREDETDPRFSKALSDFDIVWVREVFINEDGEEKHYYTLADVARLTEVRPLQEVYLHGERPFVIGTCMIEPHRSIPDAPVHISKGVQKEANEIANTRLDNVKLVLNKRWLVRRGKQVDLQSLVRNAPASVTLVNDIDKDVFPIEFNDVTSSSYAEQDRVNVDFDELLGSFSTGSVATNRKLGETVGGLNMLKGSSNSMTQYLIRVFSETWVEKVLNQLDLLEQYYESDMELLTLMAKRANVQKYGFNAVTKDLLMAPAQVVVNVANSAMDPTVRLELFTFAMSKYAEFRQMMPPDIDPEPVKGYIFGLLGFRDAARFSVDADDPQMAAAQAQIQQLQQALESKMMEIQANNEAKFAKIESDTQAKAAELEQREIEGQREARMEKFLAEMAHRTEILIASMQNDTKQQMANASEETKRLAAEMQSNTAQVVASMKGDGKSGGVTFMDSSMSEQLNQMIKSFEQIAQAQQINAQIVNQFAQSLEANTKAVQEMMQTVEAERENEIVERDESGMPVKTRSRLVR